VKETSTDAALKKLVAPLIKKLAAKMKKTVERPPRKRNQKTAAKKNLKVLNQPHTAAKELWADETTPIFLDSHDNDTVYRNSSWNTLFPGSSIDIYEWVESSLLPADWNAQADTDTGITLGISGTTLYDNSVYSVERKYDNVSKSFRNTYFYWVKNKATVPNIITRHISAQDVSELIANPRGQGYKFLAITGTNSFSLVNASPLLEDKNLVLSVQYWIADHQNQSVHSQWKIISRNPTTILPQSIELKWFDSLCGKDEQGRLVPDPVLAPKIKYGVENRPRQSMFVNRFEALKQLFEKVNIVLSTEQIIGQKNISLLESHDLEPNINLGLYDVVFDTDASRPTAALSFPLLSRKATIPTAVFPEPVTLFCIAAIPIAVLFTPVVFAYKALSPIATLWMPIVFEYNAPFPTAVLLEPVVLKGKVL
jgi:hypothetical protein